MTTYLKDLIQSIGRYSGLSWQETGFKSFWIILHVHMSFSLNLIFKNHSSYSTEYKIFNYKHGNKQYKFYCGG